MNSDGTDIIIIQKQDGTLNHCIYSQQNRKYEWVNNYRALKDILTNTCYEDYKLIILPDREELTSYLQKGTALIISKGYKKVICTFYPELENTLWEVNEQTNSMGGIIIQLSEPEINKALRYVFRNKPDFLLLALTNSHFNSSHEIAIKNVIQVAGYNAIRTIINI